MEELLYTNRDFAVWDVSELLSGKGAAPVSHDANTGSGSGLARVALSGGCANFLATVPSHLKVLKITGLNTYQRSKWNILRSNIWSTMRLTFTKTDAC
jgi:hypothetical protein